MKYKQSLLIAAGALTLISAVPAMATSTQSVTQKTSTVNPDGSVSYESHTVETKAPGGVTTTVAVVPIRPVATFYYYEPKVQRIVSAGDLTNDVIAVWDTNHNNVIDNHEFYNNAFVMYEPIEYSKRTYQDIDGNGIPELTVEEYTTRVQRLPLYGSLNKDKKEGLTLQEFTGVGFQDADKDNDNQVSYDELKEAFYHQEGLIPKPEKINQ